MNMRNIALWAVIAALLIALFSYLQSPNTEDRGNEITYTQMLKDAEAGQIFKAEIRGQQIYGEYEGGQRFNSTMPQLDMTLAQRLADADVDVTVQDAEGGAGLIGASDLEIFGLDE